MRRSLLLLLPSLLAFAAIPDGFVDIREVVPSVRLDVRYHSHDNFVGTPIDGYDAPRCLMTAPTAEALRAVQDALYPFGLGLKLFDAYRPQRAVDHFVRWAEDLNATKMKARYYPDVPKNTLFSDGYIAHRSGHSRGSTVDLTLIDLQSGRELDMGTHWDHFGPDSWPTSPRPTAAQRAHRMLLQSVMTRHGFRGLKEEWWHFTLEDEPFADRYFDFVIE